MTLSRVVVLNDVSTAQGGMTGLALLSIRLLRERGVPVTFLCGDDGDNAELQALGVDVVPGGGSRLLSRGQFHAASRGIYDPDTRSRISDWIAAHDEPGTVYHMHGWAQVFSPSVFRALSPVASRCFLHSHDMFLACPNGVYMDYPRGKVCHRRPLSAACILTQCDKRSYLHKSWRVARQVMLRQCLDVSLPWAGLIQIHPDMQPRLARAGYPDSIFRTVRNPATPYSKARIEAEANDRFIYVGRLEADKGVLGFAEAAARVGVPTTFIGDGPLRGEIARRLPSAEITGWLKPDEIGGHVARGRVLVMPSKHPEPFALVLAEAVQSGLPVAVSNTALMAPEIEKAGLGLSFDAADPRDVDRVLADFSAMPTDRLHAMSVAGHSGKVRLSLSPDEWVEALLELYREAVSRSARAA